MASIVKWDISPLIPTSLQNSATKRMCQETCNLELRNIVVEFLKFESAKNCLSTIGKD